MVNCKYCGVQVPQERVEELGVDYCVECASTHTPKLKGFMVFEHKTGGSIIFVDEDDKEKLRLAERANRRSR